MSQVDVEAVDALLRAAFPTPAEADLVRGLRDGGHVAVEITAAGNDGGVAGHVVLSRITVGGAPALALTSVAVREDHRDQGLGAALVNAALDEAAETGETLVVVVGDPDWFEQFGFGPAAELGVTGPHDGPRFQVLRLSLDAPTGAALYPSPPQAL